MSLRLAVMLAAALGLATACSEEKKKDDSKQSAAVPDPAASDGADAAGTGSARTTEDDETGAGLGLPNFCTFAKNAKGDGCFTCTPRELPIEQCSKIAADFDASKACVYNLTEVSCNTGAAGNFKLNFSAKTKLETIYEKVSLLVIAAKAMLNGKIQDKPLIKDLVFGVLDVIDAHKKAIFTGKELAPIADALAALVVKFAPGIDAAQVASFKTAALSAIKMLQTQVAGGKGGPTDIAATFSSIFEALPPEVSAVISEDLDIAKILELIQLGTSDKFAEGLLDQTGNNPIVDELLKNGVGGTMNPKNARSEP